MRKARRAIKRLPVSIPEIEPREAYDDMVRFAQTVTDATLHRLLEVALDGKGAFRRFKNALQSHNSERERWFAFKDERMVERVREWRSSSFRPSSGEDGPVEVGSSSARW